MEDQPRPQRRRTRVLAVCQLALVISELTIATVRAVLEPAHLSVRISHRPS